MIWQPSLVKAHAQLAHGRRRHRSARRFKASKRAVKVRGFTFDRNVYRFLEKAEKCRTLFASSTVLSFRAYSKQFSTHTRSYSPAKVHAQPTCGRRWWQTCFQIAHFTRVRYAAVFVKRKNESPFHPIISKQFPKRTRSDSPVKAHAQSTRGRRRYRCARAAADDAQVGEFVAHEAIGNNYENEEKHYSFGIKGLCTIL